MKDVKKVSKSCKKYKTLKRVCEYIQQSKKTLLVMAVLQLLLITGLTHIQEALERRLDTDDYCKKSV